MTQVLLSEAARLDLMRLADFLADKDPVAALVTTDLIFEALGLLQRHPRVGRRVTREVTTGDISKLRELVIQRGRSGYLALYRLDENDQTAEILAIRHQRESGYHGDDL